MRLCISIKGSVLASVRPSHMSTCLSILPSKALQSLFEVPIGFPSWAFLKFPKAHRSSVNPFEALRGSEGPHPATFGLAKGVRQCQMEQERNFLIMLPC